MTPTARGCASSGARNIARGPRQLLYEIARRRALPQAGRLPQALALLAFGHVNAVTFEPGTAASNTGTALSAVAAMLRLLLCVGVHNA